MTELENWKEKLVAEFREWLDTVDSEPFPSEEPESAPDMLRFFGELTALRQEVGLQTRSMRKSSQEMFETLSVLKDSLSNGSSQLETALQDVKSQIPQIRSTAEETVLLELIHLREALSENTGQFCKQKLCSIFTSKKDVGMLQNAQHNQKLLLKKADDILRRFDVFPVAKIGDAFKASEMCAVTSVKNAAVPPGCVSEIFVQGFRRKEKLLSTAEVEVRSQ